MVLLFVTDIHHLMLLGLFDSYTLFSPGTFPPVEDFANFSAELLSRVFVVAVQMSSPLIAVGLLLTLG